MIQIWIWTISSVVIVSLISIIGLIFLSINKKTTNSILFILVSLSVGALFGDAFIHLIPQSYQTIHNQSLVSSLILAGILSFFVLEKFIHWHHGHCAEDHHRIKPFGYINLVSDGAHNFIDGVLIGASYLVSIEIGIATTIAVILHEIPQEIGDFGILLRAGFTTTKALWFNLLSASTAIIGAIITLLANNTVENIIPFIVPLTAGGFIYIAGSDLVPDLHHETDPKKSILQFLAIIVGISIMFLLLFLE